MWVTKSFIMVCGPKKTKTRKFVVKGKTIEKVPFFSYLGIVFNRKLRWENMIASREQQTSRNIEALFRFASKLGHKPVKEILTLYRSKCRSVLSYGAGVWGTSNLNKLQILENKFVKRLLMVPSSSPTNQCFNELGMDKVEARLKIAPLILWGKIWTSEDVIF